MPVLVQNLEPGPTVFTDLPKNLIIEWQGAGDKFGDDVQQVPDDIVDNMNFAKAVRSGIFEIVQASDEVQAKLQRQGLNYHQGQQALRDAATGLMDETSEQTLTEVAIEEGGKNVGKVTVKQKQAPAKRRKISENLGHVEIPQESVSSFSNLIDHPKGFDAIFGEALPDQK